MNFATLLYAVFLLAVVVVYWLIPRRLGRYWLIFASLVFYGSWNVFYIPGFAVLLIANWLLGSLAVLRPRTAIALAVAINLGVLGYFKYADWFLDSGAWLIRRLTGQQPGFDALGIILPLAISFVTFTMLAYVIDIARGGRPERDLGRFALFVTFFPHLIAGPIMRAHEFLPQVRHPRPFRLDHVRLAIPLLVGGLLKKSIGDTLAPTVNQVFADPALFSSAALFIGVLAFAFQIFFDFSGYTDMALGSAQLLGFKLPRNFDWPYRSGSIQEFWRRWHMTLSRWLRDYLYFPLGGSRRGAARTYLALMITMLLGGLWHGAGWTFVAWGAWHGAGLAVHRPWRERVALRGTIPAVIGIGLTFAFVLIGWVFFRAASMREAATVLQGVVAVRDGQAVSIWIAALCGVLLVGQWPGWVRIFDWLLPHGSGRRTFAYGAALAVGIMLMPVTSIEFIYFQF